MNKTTSYRKCLLIKLLMLIPNIILIYIICGFLYATMGTIHIINEPFSGYYKSTTFNNGYNVILLITVVLSLIYLFCVTEKKYLFMFRSGIITCLCLTALIYLMGNESYKTQERMRSYQSLKNINISELMKYTNKANNINQYQ